MVALVFVRSLDDRPSSLEAVNAFLQFRRSPSERTHDEEIAGVWVSDDLDTRIPTSEAEAGLAIAESCALAGVWACEWLDGPPVDGAPTAAVRRDAVVRALTGTTPRSGESTERGQFFPVFASDVPLASVADEVRALRARYPHTVGSGWFSHDRTRGLVAGAPVSDSAP